MTDLLRRIDLYFACDSRLFMSVTILQDTLGLILLVAVSACGVKPVLAPLATFPSECAIPSDSAAIPDTISVVLTDPTDQPGTFWDAWSNHHLVVGHLYETLITVDCIGGIHPGLAASWSADPEGRRWTFVLRRDARFWDGSWVRAVDVQRSLMDSDAGISIIDSIVVSDDRTVIVFANESTVNFPFVLAAPSFTVSKASQASGLIQGSGPFRLDLSESPPSGASVYTLKPTAYSAKKKPVLQFTESAARDERDLLIGDVDLLVTSDPTVLDYARLRNQFSVLPLPWDRTYILLSATRVSDILSGNPTKILPQSFLDSLARDAVRRDARGHLPSAWFDRPLACTDGAQTRPQSNYSGGKADELIRVLYDRADPVARQLAERIVALGNTGQNSSTESDAVGAAIPGINENPGALRAYGASHEEMEQSLALGSDFAYIVAQSLRSTDACIDAENLLRRAPWLSPLGRRLRQGLVPLVDTRQNLIVRTGIFALTFDWFGNIRIDSGSTEK